VCEIVVVDGERSWRCRWAAQATEPFAHAAAFKSRASLARAAASRRGGRPRLGEAAVPTEHADALGECVAACGWSGRTHLWAAAGDRECVFDAAPLLPAGRGPTAFTAGWCALGDAAASASVDGAEPVLAYGCVDGSIAVFGGLAEQLCGVLGRAPAAAAAEAAPAEGERRGDAIAAPARERLAAVWRRDRRRRRRRQRDNESDPADDVRAKLCALPDGLRLAAALDQWLVEPSDGRREPRDAPVPPVPPALIWAAAGLSVATAAALQRMLYRGGGGPGAAPAARQGAPRVKKTVRWAPLPPSRRD